MINEKIISLVFSGLIILISGILNLILFHKRKKFPYIHFNSFWERIILSLVFISQIYCLIYNIFIETNYFYVFKGIKILIFDVLICISIIARAYNIYCLIYNNYLIISQNFYEIVNYIKKENGEMLFTKNYRKNFIHLKFFTILGLFFILIPFLSIKNFTLIFYFFYEQNEQSKNIKVVYFSIYYSHIIYLLILSSLSIIYSLIKKYPINQDKFYCISEINHLIKIIFISSSIKTFIVIFIRNSLDKSVSLFIDSIFNCFILILYSTLIIIRNKNFKEKNSLLNIEDIDIFLSTEIRFKIFQNYISKKHEKSLKLLKFYADYYNYHQIVYKSKQKIKSLYNEKMHERTYSDEIILEKNEEEIIDSNEEKIREKAKQIYLDYFSNVNISNSNDKEFNSIIEFPIDIYEKVQECYNTNFTINQNEKIFNEAFGWIKEKLIAIFNEYSSSSDEMEKMKKILFFIDCFEENENKNIDPE